MIRRIGVIYQDSRSLGFLRGLRDRLKCEAELIDPPTGIGTTRDLPARQAKLAWMFFQKRGVELVVRFTDADGPRWQKVRSDELQRVPPEANSVWICGVAVNCVEDWLALDLKYIATFLHVEEAELANVHNRVGVIKRALADRRSSDERQSDFVARLVYDAPQEVFRRWLKDDALKSFYTDCRSAAIREDCPTPNELESGKNE